MTVVFLPRKGFDIHRCRALACLAFAVRARNSHPTTTYWALQVCGLQQIPSDIAGAASLIKRPNYRIVASQTQVVEYTELMDPLVSGLRYIADPLRTAASAAEHRRILMALDYIAPVIARELTAYADEFAQFAGYFGANGMEDNAPTRVPKLAAPVG